MNTKYNNNLLVRYTTSVTNNPKPYLILLAIVSLLACVGMLRVFINATIYFIPKDYPSRVTEQQVKQIFDASGEQAVVAIETAKQDVFNLSTLKTIADLTLKFESISFVKDEDAESLRRLQVSADNQSIINALLKDGLDQKDYGRLKLLENKLDGDAKNALQKIILNLKPVKKVRSLMTAEDIREIDDTLYTGKLLESVPQSDDDIVALKKAVLDNPLYRGLLIASGEPVKATSIMIELNIAEDDAPSMVKAHDAITQIINSQQTDDRLYLGGGPMLAVQIDQSVQMDNLKYFPFVIITISILLFVFFRRKQAVYLPVSIATITILWSMGAMVGVGISVNIITSVLPVFVMTIAVADAVHYLSKYYELRETMDAKSAVLETNQRLLTPMLLTSITTIAGFLALGYSLFSQVQHFSIFTALGVLFAFFITITLLPALLPKLAAKEQPVNSADEHSAKNIQWPVTLGKKFDALVAKSTLTISIVVLLVIAGLVPYIFNLQADNHNMAAFSENTRLRQDDKVLNHYFGGTIPLNIWFKGEQENSIATPEAMVAIEKINQRLLQHAEVGYTATTANMIKRLHQVFNPEHPYAMPDELSSQLIAQYLLLLENGEGQDIRITLDQAHKNSRIFVLGHTDQASVWEGIIEDTRQYAKTVLPQGISIHFSGFADVMVKNTHEVVNGQIISISIAVVVILFIVTLLFKNLLMGMITIIPLIFTLLLNFAAMVFTGVFLDIGTSLIIAIVFGVGVDYAIHYLSILVDKCQQGIDPETALKETAAFISRPVIINSIVVASGFLALTMSDYAVVAKLGLLVSSTIFFCGFFTLLLAPLLIRVFKPGLIYRVSKKNQLASETN
ncbi:efflux RND transporter permease subunit [Aliikangiella maris]|uniref:MMPL family transporter n=2 Tax=Aliikangiella maris TaxID=3162458 RepID=A0ABV3MIX2_9GAMM